MSAATAVGRIVVGIDASAESDQALAWARDVAGPDDRIVAVHAWEIPLVTGYDVVVSIDPNEIEQAAKAGLAELIDRVGDDRIVPVVRQGHAGRAIVAEAEASGAGLIVVGHRGRGRISMMLGSTANYVVHHTSMPVVVVRGEDPRAPRRVVVGVDGHGDEPDPASVRAVQWAAALPGVDDVRVVHAWFLPALAVGAFASLAAELDAMDSGARRVLDRVLEAAGPGPDGVTIHADSVRGTPGFALVEASRDTDLVVVGSRGRGGFAGLLLGSTSAEVAAHAHSPVAVVR